MRPLGSFPRPKFFQDSCALKVLLVYILFVTNLDCNINAPSASWQTAPGSPRMVIRNWPEKMSEDYILSINAGPRFRNAGFQGRDQNC